MRILAPSELEQLECRFMTSLHDAGSELIAACYAAKEIVATHMLLTELRHHRRRGDGRGRRGLLKCIEET